MCLRLSSSTVDLEISLFGNGSICCDSIDLPAGDCVKAGVGGSLDDDAGAVETGGVLPKDRVSVCDGDIGQYTTIQYLFVLPTHEKKRP